MEFIFPYFGNNDPYTEEIIFRQCRISLATLMNHYANVAKSQKFFESPAVA